MFSLSISFPPSSLPFLSTCSTLIFPLFCFSLPHLALLFSNLSTLPSVYDYLKRPGERFSPGEALAVCRRLDGSLLCTVTAEHPGFVIGWLDGVMKMEGQLLGLCGLPDRLPMVAPWHAVLETGVEVRSKL